MFSGRAVVVGAQHAEPQYLAPECRPRLRVGSAVYGQARIKFPPGTIIALYTDGLVETRTRSFDQGILALRSALPCGPGQLDTACDRLISSLAERSEDDVTVVLARIPAIPG